MQSGWCESPYGEFVLQQEAKLLQQALTNSANKSVALICDESVQERLLGESLGINKPCVFNAKFMDSHLCASNTQENIETDSVDWVILWHGLERLHDPRVLLREVTRILSDGGRLTVFGFNPMRKVSRKFWFWKDKTDTNVQNELSLFRLNDWLRLLNYDVTQINTFVSPNLSRIKRHRNRCSQLQHVNTFPLLGLVYHYEAMLKHFTLTPMRVAKRTTKQRALQLVNHNANIKKVSVNKNVNLNLVPVPVKPKHTLKD